MPRVVGVVKGWDGYQATDSRMGFGSGKPGGSTMASGPFWRGRQ